MNWAAINFDWNQVRAFLATMEEGSLSAAARALGLTQPTLGRQVAALEEHLGVTLFERSGRHLMPTPAAFEIAEHVKAMGEAAARFSLAASGQSQSIEGVVKISATEMYSAMVLPGLIQTLIKSHPGIVIEIIATNSLSNLRQREADIAIRNTEPTDPDMIARRMTDERGGMFATADLVRRHGPFETLADLKDAPFIGFGSTSTILKALTDKGVPATQANFVAMSDNHLVHWELAKRGIGIGLNGWDVGCLYPGMQRILEDDLMFEFPVWLVAPRELKTNARVRVVFDALADHLTGFKAEHQSVKKSA
ncbi:MAG: LysR family transcriptional regulator [Silicimonas sp.]|nr:LysR family transcriptional regulator [Silicimonas sp.]